MKRKFLHGKIIFTILFISFCICGVARLFAQNGKAETKGIDNMLYKKLLTLNTSIYEHRFLAPEKALEYGFQALSLSSGMELDSCILGDTYWYMGQVYSDQGLYTLALQSMIKGMNIYKNCASYSQIGGLLLDLGDIYYKQGFTDYSGKTYHLSVDYYEKDSYNRKGLANSFQAIASFYAKEKEFDVARSYISLAYKLSIQENDSLLIAETYRKLGDFYCFLAIRDSSLMYYDSALLLFKSLGHQLKAAQTYFGIAQLKENTGAYKDAYIFFQKSLMLYRHNNDKINISKCLLEIAKLFEKMGKYSSVLNYVNEASSIAEQNHLLNQLKESYLFLSDFYEKNNDLKMAFKYQKLYSDVKDSLSFERASKTISDILLRQERNLRTEEVVRLKSLNELKDLKLRKQRALNRMYVFAAVLLLLVFVLILLAYRRKRRDNLALHKWNEKIIKQEQKLKKVLNDLHRTELERSRLLSEKTAILKALPDLIFTFDKQGKYLDFHAFDNEELIIDPQELKGKYLHEVLPEKVANRALEVISELENIGDVRQFIYTLNIKGDDKVYDARIVKSSVNGFLAIVRNISMFKQSEQRLIDAREEALKATRSKSMFLASMSHEIRNPMHVIIGMIDVLKATPLSKEQMELVNMIDISGNNLLSIINNILDFSKIESGQITLEKIPINIHSEIENVFLMLRIKAREKGNVLKMNLDKDVPLLILGDPLRLRQVILNLVNNANKFTTKGEIKVSVENLGKTDDGLCKLRFCVSDTGIGISKEEKDHLFKEYAQANTSTSRKYGGSGLGLAISKNLIKLMGGDIGVESEKGVGSKFWFTILAGKEISAKALIEENKEPDNEKSKPSELKILLVEDNPTNQNLESKILNQIGYKFDMAGNGMEAVEMFMKNTYDVILMDIQMPEMDGLEATEVIRKIEAESKPDKAVKIIAITAFASDYNKKECIAAGMDNFLTKPFKVSELESAIEGKKEK